MYLNMIYKFRITTLKHNAEIALEIYTRLSDVVVGIVCGNKQSLNPNDAPPMDLGPWSLK